MNIAAFGAGLPGLACSEAVAGRRDAARSGYAPAAGCWQLRTFGSMIQNTKRDESFDGNCAAAVPRGAAASRRPSANFTLGLMTQWLTRMPRSLASRSRQNSDAGVVYPASRIGSCFHRRSRSSKNNLVTSPRIAVLGMPRSVAPAANTRGSSNRSSKIAWSQGTPRVLPEMFGISAPATPAPSPHFRKTRRLVSAPRRQLLNGGAGDSPGDSPARG